MNETAPVEPVANGRKRIRRLIVLVLLISLGVHVVVGLIAGVWVVAHIFAKPPTQFVSKNIDMKPENRRNRLAMDEVSSLRPKPVYNNRIQSLAPSKLALPDLPSVPVDTTVPLDTDALLGSQVEGFGSGYGEGTGGDSPFGAATAAASGLLQGTFYDLKQTADGKPTNMTNEEYAKVVTPVVTRGRTGTLKKFYAAPSKLYLSKIAIPVISADKAPAAFNVADKVKPKHWLAIYEGEAICPETGRYTFEGFADDVLVVLVNGRPVFDGSLHNMTKIPRDKPVEFLAQKGRVFKITVIMGEIPGGQFNAWLQLKKDGGKPYWFRMTNDPVQIGADENKTQVQVTPTSNEQGPAWLPAGMKKSVNEVSGLGGL